MRIAVYAICKNESQFVDRWMDSMSEADQVVVLDTGSTDDTVERLKKRGAQVTVELTLAVRCGPQPLSGPSIGGHRHLCVHRSG